ncbi:MAG: MAPEG family protein [Parvularculaceae bacterium]
MTSIEAAGLWAGLNLFFLVFISARVGQARMKTKTNLGDGGDPEMIKAIRTQGNYIEYAPAAVGGLVLMALLGASTMMVHIFGGVFLFARVSHLLGLGMGVWPMGRMVGTMLTMLTLAATGGTLLWLALS